MTREGRDPRVQVMRYKMIDTSKLPDRILQVFVTFY